MYDGCNYEILVYLIYVYSLVGTLVKSNNNNNNSNNNNSNNNMYLCMRMHRQGYYCMH